MCVLKLTIGKIIFLQIFLRFLFFSVKGPNDLCLCPDGCDSDGRTVRLHVRTCKACRMLMCQRASGRVSNPSGLGPHRLYVKNPTLAAASSHFLSSFLAPFCPFCEFFSWVIAQSRLFLSFYAFFSPFKVFFFSVLFILFNVLLTIRILNFLGNVFEIKNAYL
jgi:hypothetical protein